VNGKIDVLIEVGAEEIPDRFLEGALTEIRERWLAAFADAQLAVDSVETCGTPRRLTVTIRGLAAAQDDRDEKLVGPPVKAAFDADGNPTQAAIGFAKKCGVEPSELERVDDPKGERVAALRHVPGRSAQELIADTAPQLYGGLPWPKNMTWGDCTYTWVRPVHWIVALAGTEVIDFEFLGIRSGRTTRGHRTLAGGPLDIASVDAYAGALREVHVIADRAERRRIIDEGLEREASAAGGEVLRDEGLVKLTSDLVEWPVVVTGRFTEEFLELPDVVIQSAMRDHQRFFAVKASGDGALLPCFLHVAGQADPDGSIASNNSSVLVARLDDSRFFWRKDLERPLAARCDELERVLFHERLGSYADKIARMSALAGKVLAMPGAVGVDGDALLAAITLCKADQTTDMVKEFTTLQGIMGGIYLRKEGGHAEATARAVEEHYLPNFQGDALPESPEGALLALIDRLDTLVGCFGVGLIPSGSKDPFALRRASQGLISILAGRGLKLPLDELLEAAAAGFAETAGFERTRVSTELRDYLRDRIRFVLGLEQRQDEIEAALGSSWSDLPGLVGRVQGLAAVRGAERRDDFEALSLAFKRVRNILRGQEAQAPNPGALVEEAEKALSDSLAPLGEQMRSLMSAGDYLAACEALAGLRGAVDRFFEEVLVMADDETLKNARLGLLQSVESLFLEAADISQIVVAGND
jgi:glycyl-tRNA synthetase beta chain